MTFQVSVSDEVNGKIDVLMLEVYKSKRNRIIEAIPVVRIMTLIKVDEMTITTVTIIEGKLMAISLKCMEITQMMKKIIRSIRLDVKSKRAFLIHNSNRLTHLRDEDAEKVLQADAYIEQRTTAIADRLQFLADSGIRTSKNL